MSSSTPSPRTRSDTLCTTGKRVRTSKPKVRSGCVTCKARRIKCDEMKPACDRCTKFGRECGGYKVQLTYEERVAARNGRSRILPKVYQASSSLASASASPPLLQILPNPLPPSINVPLTPQQIFCIEASLELCRILEFPQWTSIKVEICKQNPYIGHAFSAIRMLSKAPTPTAEFIDPQLQGHDPNLYTLHYERFLEGSRLSLSTGPNQPLLASIICLLTIALETLQFHHEPALSHIQLGLTLIPQLPIQERQTSFFNDEITHAFHMLESKANLLDSYFPFYAPMPLGFTSPFVIPQLFCAREEETFDAFVGFADQGVAVFESRASSVASGTP